MYTKVTLAGITYMSFPLAGGEWCVLDMSGENKVRRECSRAGEWLGSVDSASQLEERAAARETDGSNSRYEEPEAVGINPVLRTRGLRVSCDQQEACRRFIQIFRNSAGWRWRWARFAMPVEDSCRDANTGGLVPPGGPLIRLLSAILGNLAQY